MKHIVSVSIGITILLFSAFKGSVHAVTRYQDHVFHSYAVTKNIKYGSAPRYKRTGNETLLLDIYTPPQTDTETKRPVIIWIHGGSFVIGDKTSYEGLCIDYAKRGYVAITINYRLADHEVTKTDPEAPAIIQMAKADALAAVRWARANAATYGINANAIVVAGHSAGAVTALYAAYDTEDVGASGNPGVSSLVKAAVSVAGAIMPDRQNTIGPSDPPSILLHGELDTTVPYAYAQDVDKKLTAVNVAHEFYHYPTVKHNMVGASDVDQRIISFLYRYVVQNTPPTITKPGDFDNNNAINIIDFTLFMGYWWVNDKTKADFNGDNAITAIDYTIFLNYWYDDTH